MPVAAVPGMHVHRLDLGAEAATPMEVTEHDELADADDLATQLGHEHGPDAFVDLAEGRSVEGDVAALGRRPPGTAATRKELDDARQVGIDSPADQYRLIRSSALADVRHPPIVVRLDQRPLGRSRNVMARRGQSRAARRAAADQLGRERLAVDDGIPPLVERDRLGQQLGAIAVGIAGDGVDEDAHGAHAHRCRPGTAGTWVGSNTGRALRGRAPHVCFEHGQRAAHQVHRAVRMAAGAPAVHGIETPVQRAPGARRRPCRDASRAMSSAMAGRP